jgi:GNAT superfamily N-acetyltransferase
VEDERVRIEPVSAASVEARVLVALYVDELAATFPDGFDVDRTTSADPDEVTPPRGNFLVVRADDGNPVGCGAVKVLDPTTAEIKRMWLAPEIRGKGVGKQLLAALEDAARDLGVTRAVLDTNDALTPANGLYTDAGWVTIEPFNDNPYATRWFGKDL